MAARERDAVIGALHGAGEARFGIVETALELVFGPSRADNFGRADAAQSCRRALGPGAVICWGASEFDASEFRECGYPIVRRFVALPSRANPKWLLPCDDRRAAGSALRACTSYSRRLPRITAMAAAGLNWPYMRRSTVLVASREKSYLETIAQEVAGQEHLGVALSIGAPGIFRKVSARWMRSDGDVVCHTKLPMTLEANARIFHEAGMLNALGGHGEFRPRIPRPIRSGTVGGMRFLVQSSLEGEAGPIQFGPGHKDWLQMLCRYRPTRRSGGSIVEGVGEGLRRNVCRMGSRWEVLGADALRMAYQKLRGDSIDCGLSHGDFTPWNTVLRDGQLAVFDWEAAEMDVPRVWDKFHFLTQTRSLLGTRGDAGIRAEMTPKDHALYLLYLLDSAIKLAVEETRSNGVEYREAELRKQLRLGSQMHSTPTAIPIGTGAGADVAACGLPTRVGTIGP